MQSVSLQSLLEDTLELCTDKFRYHGVDLKFQSEVKGHNLECRPTQLLQVFVNLLNNAYDAIQELPQKWIRIEVKPLGANFEISITDSGNGIPEAVRTKLFQTGFTTKAPDKGTGLGLNISRNIIESHGGKMRIDTECPNTRFVITLPQIQPKALTSVPFKEAA